MTRSATHSAGPVGIGTDAAGDRGWLDAMADAVVIVSPARDPRGRAVDFIVEYANPTAGDAAGCEHPEDCVGRRLSDLHPIGVAALDHLRHVLGSGRAVALDQLVYGTGGRGGEAAGARDVGITKRGDRLLLRWRDSAGVGTAIDVVSPEEDALRGLVDAVSDAALVTVDQSGIIQSWNTGAKRVYGYGAAEIVGRHVSTLYRSEDVTAGRLERDLRPEGAARTEGEAWRLRRGGARFWAHVVVTPIRSPSGAPLGFATVTRDITERRRERWRAMQLDVARTIDDSPHIDDVCERLLEITTVGLGAAHAEMWIAESSATTAVPQLRCQFTRPGLSEDTVADTALTLAGHAALIDRVWSTGDAASLAGPQAHGEPSPDGLATARRDAIAVPISKEGRDVGVLACFFQATDGADAEMIVVLMELGARIGRSMVRARDLIALQGEVTISAELALTDPLTGLKNRRDFDRLLATIPRQPFAILAIDIDHLKQINDDFGHDAGDAVIQTIAHTLQFLLRGWDAIARVGGDEFGAMLVGVGAAEAEGVAERLRTAMHLIHAPHNQAQISIGWAYAPSGADPRAVWKTADQCLYKAKRGGRDRVVGCDVSKGDSAPEKEPSNNELLSELLAGKPLHSVYQPIVGLSDGHVLGYEALARPIGFAPTDSVERLFVLASRSGDIRALDWICRGTAVGHAIDLPGATQLFINVSAAAILGPRREIDQLLALLETAERAASSVVLEITERERVRDPGSLLQALAAYRRRGFRFALDDVGDGHWTMELLTAAGAEYLKIARSLTMTSSRRESRAAIEATIVLADSSGATVIAEGVENELASERLRALGIEFGQGFGLGKPTPPDEVADSVAEWEGRAALRQLRPRHRGPRRGRADD